MKEYIAFDSHKHYTLAETEEVETGKTLQQRINHQPGAIRRFLQRHGAVPGTAVAVEATGNWYWIVDEIEQAGFLPLLVHPRKAKLMMGMVNKTDALDVHGLNRLQRNGVLPTVWVPPAPLRDLREVTRTRLVFVQARTRMKNRITATLSKYGLRVEGARDAYAQKARAELAEKIGRLPLQTQTVTGMMWSQVRFADEQVRVLEKLLREMVRLTPEMRLLKTLPGVADLLASTIALEIGTIDRFASAERLASYAGTTPRVHSSGGKTRYGQLRPDVNRYLRWAYVEAANSPSSRRRTDPAPHVAVLYQRLKQRRGHAKAIGAVARHLAEASYHILTKKEPYRDPQLRQRSSQGGASARTS